MRIEISRRERIYLVSILLHLIAIGLVLHMRAKPYVPKQRPREVRLLLQPRLVPQQTTPRLRFQKTGPESSQNRLGLPPSSTKNAPAGDVDPPSLNDARGGKPAAPQPSPPTPPPPSPAVISAPADPAPPAPSRMPFTSSLDAAALSAAALSGDGAAGGGSSHGAGRGGGRPGHMSGDASFSFDSGGFDLSEWAEQVKRKVRSNWIIPTAAYLGMKGVVGIHLIVERNGVISLSEIVGQSGIPSMDSAALNAIRSSSPLPALPPGFPKVNLDAQFTFYYNVPPPE